MAARSCITCHLDVGGEYADQYGRTGSRGPTRASCQTHRADQLNCTAGVDQRSVVAGRNGPRHHRFEELGPEGAGITLDIEDDLDLNLDHDIEFER
jgi:hypothetical protein